MNSHARQMALTGCILMVSCSVALSQTKPEPPERTGALPEDSVSVQEDRRLPRIDLPEFVITGNETIVLPDASKSVYEDQGSVVPDPSGEIGREARDPRLGPGAADRGAFAPSIEGVNGRITAGYGSYQTPFFDGWFGKEFGTSDFLLKAGYKSSEGFARNTEFRRGYGAVSGGAYLPADAGFVGGARMQGTLSLSEDTYQLYGSIAPEERRTLDRFSTDVTLSSDVPDAMTYSAALRMHSTSLRDRNHSREIQLGTDLSAVGDIGEVEVKGEVGLWTGFYKSPSQPDNPVFSQLGVSGKYRIARDVDLSGGLGFYYLGGSDGSTAGNIYPRLGVSWYALESVTLFARFEPFVQRSGMEQLIEWNPYLVNDIRIRHPEHFVNLSAGVETELSRTVKANAVFRYKRIQNYPTFVDNGRLGSWSVQYFGVTRIIEFSVDVHANLSAGDYVGGSFMIRDGNNSSSGLSVPYLPSASISGIYSHRFSFPLTVGTAMTLQSSQYADVQNVVTLPAFILVDLTAEYVVMREVSVSGGLSNLFNQPHRSWDGYAGQPRTAMLSASYRW